MHTGAYLLQSDEAQASLRHVGVEAKLDRVHLFRKKRELRVPIKITTLSSNIVVLRYHANCLSGIGVPLRAGR